jgi:hypothetical protein
MDKQMLKAYIKVVVEEEVKRLLPEMLSEAVQEIKQLKENYTPAPAPRPAVDRSRMAALLGIDYDRENGVISAGTSGMSKTTATPNYLQVTDDAGNTRNIPASAVDPSVVNAITKDYSALMKAMKLT